MERQYIREINRLDNEYHSLRNQAMAANMANGGAVSREEGKLYQKAAEVCARAASMSVSAAQDKWIERQIDCEGELRHIVEILNPRAVKNMDAETAAAQAKKKNAAASGQQAEGGSGGKAPGSPAAGGNGGKAPGNPAAGGRDEISEETVASWFREAPKTGFEGVAGMEDLKALMERIIRDIGNASLNAFFEMETVQSFFFYGLPGCGKTFLLEAFAHELIGRFGFKYMSLSGADIHESLVGRTEKIIKRMFEEAEKNAPCILFIDEIDGVCGNRKKSHQPAHVISATNQFLTSYNDLIKSDKQVIFIGATNNPEDVDIAMLDRVELIEVDLPDAAARANYFKMRLEHIIRNEEGFSYEDMAAQTEDFNYRDLRKFTARLKKELVTEIGVSYGNDTAAATKAMEDNAFCLKGETFRKVREEYHLLPKDTDHLKKWAQSAMEELGG